MTRPYEFDLALANNFAGDNVRLTHYSAPIAGIASVKAPAAFRITVLGVLGFLLQWIGAFLLPVERVV